MGSENPITDIQKDANEAAKTAKSDADAAANQLKHDADAVAHQVKKDAKSAIDTVHDGVDEVRHEIDRQAATLGDEAKKNLKAVGREASSIANEQKNLLATQIDGVADALEKVANELGAKNEVVAGYVHSAAGKAHDLTSAVRDQSVESLLTAAEDFGRRQPLLFVSGAALAGFAASRFLTASARRHQSGQR